MQISSFVHAVFSFVRDPRESAHAGQATGEALVRVGGSGIEESS
jgi:hypothetical protein